MRSKGIKEIKPRDTLRRQRLVKALAESENIYQAGQKSGYSKKSRQMYSKSTKLYIKKFLELTGNDLEKCKKRFNMLLEMNLNSNDLKKERANNENLTKMQGGFKDSGQGNITINLSDLHSEILKKSRFNEENHTISSIPSKDKEEE